jgi:hypothetical protein
MNHNFFLLVMVFSLGILILEMASAQIDPINDIEFIQTGKLFTDKKEFTISNEINIREFFDGKIIKITGYTVEGHPYITYSKIINQQITTHGKIFMGNEFVQMVFDKQNTSQIEKNEMKEKLDNMLILTQYTERLYSGQTAKIDVKIFESNQNKSKDFNQNYGNIVNTNIEITVLDKNGKTFSSSEGVTNERGFYSTEFFIPKNNQNGSFTVIIDAENKNSKSSKTIQIFNLGEVPDHDSAP